MKAKSKSRKKALRPLKAKPVKCWAAQREDGNLCGTWTSLGNGTEAITLAAFGTKTIAETFINKPCNQAVKMNPVRVLITAIQKD